MKIESDLLLQAINAIRKPQLKEPLIPTFFVMISGNVLTLARRINGCTMVKRLVGAPEPNDLENVYLSLKESNACEYLATLKNENINFRTGYDAITISKGRSRLSLETRSDHDERMREKIGNIDLASSKTFAIENTGDFVSKMKRATVFVGRNAFDQFNKICFNPCERVLYSTDGFRLNRNRLSTGTMPENVAYEPHEHIMIGYDIAPAFIELFSCTKRIVCSSIDGGVVFKSSDGTGYSEAIAFDNPSNPSVPPFHNILNIKPEAYITVNTELFKEAVKRAKIMSGDDYKVNLLVTRRQLFVYSEFTGSFVTAIETEISEKDYNFFFENCGKINPAFVVLVNGRYITDTLPTTEKVTFGLAGKTDSSGITYTIVVDSGTETNVVMPIRAVDYPLKEKEKCVEEMEAA